MTQPRAISAALSTAFAMAHAIGRRKVILQRLNPTEGDGEARKSVYTPKEPLAYFGAVMKRLVSSNIAIYACAFASGFLLALALIYINRRAILIFYTQLFG